MDDDIFGMVEHMPEDTSSIPFADVKAFADSLDDNIDNIPGYIGEDTTIDTLLDLYASDKSGYVRCEAVLRKHGMLITAKKFMKERRAARAELKLSNGAIGDGGLQLKSAIPTAPVPDGSRIPAAWELMLHASDGQHKIIRLVPRRRGPDIEIERIGVAYEHAVIEASMSDVHDGDGFLSLAWQDGPKWSRKVIPRQRLSTARGAAEELCGLGFPINAGNAADMVDYLVDYEAVNRSVIPRKLVSQQNGWHGLDRGFLLGETWINASEEELDPIEYVSADDGERQLCEAVSQKRGTIEQWREAISHLRRHPRAELAVYAALAPPLLHILSAPNFVIEWCGQTSSGKTTALMAAASVWGDPDGRGPAAFTGSWASTKVAVERRLASLCDLPVILDDTKLARVYGKESTIIPSVVYAACNGQSDARGSLTGTQRAKRWRTVVLSTGEERMVDKSRSGGTVARVLTLWGSPFASKAKVDVDAVRAGVCASYGHAGEMFVRWLLEHRSEWPIWREQWQTIQAKQSSIIARRTNDAGVAGRLASYTAVLEITARLAHRALEFDWPLMSPVKQVLPQIAKEGSTARRDKEALEAVAGYVAANLDKIEGINTGRNDDTPHTGWAGYVQPHTLANPWEHLALYPGFIKDFLSREGYEPRAILRLWSDAGFLNTAGDRNTHPVSVNGNRVQMVCIKRTILELHGFDANERSADPRSSQSEILYGEGEGQT